MPKRKLPPDDEVISMYRSGMSTGEIAEKCSVTPSTVVSCLRRLGEPRRLAGEADQLARKRGRKKATRYWEGKQQPIEMVEKRISKIRGEKHYLWKGGHHRRDYRREVDKEICARCGCSKNLGVHHRDFDHFNNVVENLEVLCVRCHMSAHAQVRWDAIHRGDAPPKSNGPVGWVKKQKGVSGGDD